MLQSIRLNQQQNLKMIRQNKDCRICVYYGPCENRRDVVDIIDCCIPEAPLRLLQKNAKTADIYIRDTKKYIEAAKRRSDYWRKTLKETL
jgi:NCAIR mutase (PurE)-related protein